MVYVLRAHSAGYAWQKAVQLIFARGKTVYDGKKRLKEVLNVVISIRNPDMTDIIVRNFGDRTMIEWMENNFLSVQPIPDWGYSYGQRLRSFLGMDQLSEAIRKLQRNPESKSATVMFALPPEDHRHMPCIIALDLKIRKEKLIGAAFFRSQDGFKKFYADILALGKIMSQASMALHIPVGTLVLSIVSLHAYTEDFKKGKRFILESEQAYRDDTA
ncbi:hypothetical protein HY948_05240 [Candidatus Gottesmanbacteria bacterium]|nr:hypothetical protein [Candidatus Gottesmanbacteria bacterium]